MHQQNHKAVNRRQFLKSAGLLGLALAGGATGVLSALTPSVALADAGAPTAQPNTLFLPIQKAAPAGSRDLEITLRATRDQVPILAGAQTVVWRYEAEVLNGDPASVTALPGSYLGPVLRVRKGQRLRVHFVNDLPEPSIVHWHGLLVPDAMDGHPRFAVGPGQSYSYDFPVINRAGTYWFHPHPDGLTGAQAYRGLAGLLIVTDDEEKALALPQGDYDLPLVLQDRLFDSANQLVYVPQSGGMMGFLGDRILVNGQVDFSAPIAARPYRLRLLNGSNSRIYKLAWRDGTPLTVIATDGGLLEQPLQRPFVMLAPGERVELWADFTGRNVGDDLFLDSLAFVGAMGNGPIVGPAAIPNGAAFPVARLRVARMEQSSETLPTRLAHIERYREVDATNATQPRQVVITQRMMAWLLNGRLFEMNGVAPDEVGRVSDLTAWEFVNTGGFGQWMGGYGMAHPMHIHGAQFQVVERQVLPQMRAGHDSVQAGYVDEGWKDTVLVMPGERVKVLFKFAQPGLFLYHCHNLEHEDQGMMRNFRVDA